MCRTFGSVLFGSVSSGAMFGSVLFGFDRWFGFVRPEFGMGGNPWNEPTSAGTCAGPAIAMSVLFGLYAFSPD